MAYINADYLCDVVGSFSDLEIRDYVVYSPNLDRLIILNAELYKALEIQEVDSVSSKSHLKNFAYNAALQVYQEQMEKEERENGL